MSNQYPNSGALFVNQKKHEKAPDYSGDLNLDITLLHQLIDESEDGFSVKIKLSGWKKQGTRGTFLSIKYNDFKPQGQRQQSNNDFDGDVPF
jgi:hypothetical protein